MIFSMTVACLPGQITEVSLTGTAVAFSGFYRIYSLLNVIDTLSVSCQHLQPLLHKFFSLFSYFETSAHQSVISIFAQMKLFDSPGTKPNHLYKISPLFSFFHLLISSSRSFVSCLTAIRFLTSSLPPNYRTQSGALFCSTPRWISLFKHHANG